MTGGGDGDGDGDGDGTLPLVLKWNGRSFRSAEERRLRVIRRSGPTPASDLRAAVQAVTGVPAKRQKLICRKLWKGTLAGAGAVVPQPPAAAAAAAAAAGGSKPAAVVAVAG